MCVMPLARVRVVGVEGMVSHCCLGAYLHLAIFGLPGSLQYTLGCVHRGPWLLAFASADNTHASSLQG